MKTFRKQTGKKKELFTKPDEFQSLTHRMMDYARENTSKVFAALGVVAVIFVVAAGFMFWRESAKKDIAIGQDEAMKYYNVNSPVPGGKPMGMQERLKKAEELFGKVASENSGPGADAALYYKANSEMGLGELDKAISGYKEVISKASANPALMTVARHRLAEAYIAKGDAQDAIETYKAEIADPNDLLRDAAHYGLAQIYQQEGKTQEALSEYNAVRKDFPGSQFAADVTLNAAMLSGAATSAQAAPAPAPAPPAEKK